MAELTVKLTSRAIVITLPLSVLPAAVEGSPDIAEYGVKVIDAKEFAKDVIEQLEDEDETGATVIHRMFDNAFLAAYEGGSYGVISDEDG